MLPPKTHIDIAIVGGGVVGSATAYYLKKHGFGGSIAIIEKDTTYQCSATARSLGGLRQQFSTPENIELSKFGLKLIRNLKAEFGADADVGFREQGYLIMASAEGLAVLEENHRTQIAHGADNVLLRGAELNRRFPYLNSEGIAAACLGLTGEGWLDPYSLMSLFRKAAIAQGVELIPGEVASLSLTGDRIDGLTLTDGRTLTLSALVNAAGAAAGGLSAMANIDLPVGPRKRYVYVLDCQNAPDLLHKGPLSVDISGIYWRPEGRNFLCGLSPEEQDEPETMDWEVDHAWFEERIWPTLAERVPVFEAVKVVNSWVGHYDYNALDQNAVFGAHPQVNNFFFANGFSGHGIQQGPAAGNATAELICFGEYRTIDLARFGYGRIARREPLFEKNVI